MLTSAVRRGEAPTALVGEWQDRAACRDQPGDWVAVPENWGVKNQRKAKASELAICERCPVIAECAEQGKRETVGIWGGKLSIERRRKR